MSATLYASSSSTAAGRHAQRKANCTAAMRVHRPVNPCVSTSRQSSALKAATLDSVATQENWKLTRHQADQAARPGLPQLISVEQVQALEAELDQGNSIAALRRFNQNLRNLPADRWEEVLRPVFVEMCYNLESFNPAFTSCLLMVQRTIGMTDYVRRDVALKNLIQPLAGEYGMHNGQQQLKTHRELFSDFYQSLFGHPLADLIAEGTRPVAAEAMFADMMRDILGGGAGAFKDPAEQASYAMGYNLAIEYLADYEKTWMLDSFRDVNQRVLGKKIDWVFLEVHAEGEAEHAAIGHNAVLNFVPESHVHILRAAMKDHDRDMATFYNHVADMLQQ